MYPRYMRPSMAAVCRPLTHEVAAISNCSARSFHISARRLEDSASNSPSTPNPPPQRQTRRARSESAFEKVIGLQPDRRPQGLAAGKFRSGQHVQTTRSHQQAEDSSSSGPAAETAQVRIGRNVEGRPPISKYSVDQPAARRTASPPGTMVRAPTTLRITRNTTDTNARVPRGGPNLGRRGGTGIAGRAVGRGSESAPKKRERPKKEGQGKTIRVTDDVKIEDTLNDGMVRQLLRLQKKEWDRVPYEPKYAHGSQAAAELLVTGKKLFEGDAPKVKVWSRLDKRIGVVGMHGA